TASLDPDTGDWVRSYLEDYRYRTGATILLASHNMAEVERLCPQVLMMKEGQIVDRGSPDELIDRYGRTNLEGEFLQIARGGPDDVGRVSLSTLTDFRARSGSRYRDQPCPSAPGDAACGRGAVLAGAGLGDVAALSLHPAQLLAAHAGAALLADPADADLGVHEPVPLPEQQLRRARVRRAPR